MVLAIIFALPAQAGEYKLDDTLQNVLSKTFGTLPDSAYTTPIDGVIEVGYGTNIFYVTKDGRYLFNGEMFDLSTRTNLSEKRLSRARKATLDGVDESSMIVYKAKGKEKHVITVFTDIDCVYCRKLHKGMDEINQLGITVRYLAFPRAGLNSPSYYKAVSVWCAKDRNKAMDDAKNLGKLPGSRCDNSPVKDELELGKKLGVTGTPGIILSDGRLMPGYLPPQKLAAMLDQEMN
jgi:thiol:disulfide interchange protein DsbC